MARHTRKVVRFFARHFRARFHEHLECINEHFNIAGLPPHRSGLLLRRMRAMQRRSLEWSHPHFFTPWTDHALDEGCSNSAAV